ncbi:MAG: AAA family ATPase [Candidatus Omnitrophica bacterium]|nr:AAA family ATPase [Candidatus Omnitrophota bacterium]
MNIVLVGFMGTGKTTVARKLVSLMNMQYISTDILIEERLSMSINDIFKNNTEEFFRKIETEAVKEVAVLDGVIIDAGGGVMIDEENVKNLKKNALIICLTALPGVILERMKDKKDRPLLNKGDKLKTIESLLQERSSYYERSNKFIDTSSLDASSVALKIKDIFESISA